MEQRIRNRWPHQGAATALRLDADAFGRMHELHLLDFGEGGLGAATPEPIEPGALVTLGFEAEHCTARRGRVVACTPTGERFRVAIRFDDALAA